MHTDRTEQHEDLEERTSGAKALVIVGPYGPTKVVP